MSDLFARHRAVIPQWVSTNYSEPIEIVSGKGCRVNDGQGNSYLDFFAGILTNMLGYDVAEVREAVERQIALNKDPVDKMRLTIGLARLDEAKQNIAGGARVIDALWLGISVRCRQWG